MKFFETSKDGGAESTVTAYWAVEIKALFSLALLRFDDGSRENYHSHAFDSISWMFRGELTEQHLDATVKRYRPSLLPIVTRRSTFHRVVSHGRTWVLTFRGPWSRTWKEFSPQTRQFTTLTHGRKEVSASPD